MTSMRMWTQEASGPQVSHIRDWSGLLGLLKIRNFTKVSYFCLLLKIRHGETVANLLKWSQTQLPPSNHTYSAQLVSFYHDTQVPLLVPQSLPASVLTWFLYSCPRKRGAREFCYKLLCVAHKEVLGNEPSLEDSGQQTWMTHKTSFKHYGDLK